MSLSYNTDQCVTIKHILPIHSYFKAGSPLIHTLFPLKIWKH